MRYKFCLSGYRTHFIIDLERKFSVPIICEFFGIKEAVVIDGELPAKQLKLVLAWCEIHRDELLKNWDSAMKHGKISKIDPLR